MNLHLQPAPAIARQQTLTAPAGPAAAPAPARRRSRQDVRSPPLSEGLALKILSLELGLRFYSHGAGRD